MEKYKEIERGLITTYRKNIWSKFVKAVMDFKMIEDGDKIAVCISGGKDSMLMAKCFQEIKRHRKMDFDLKFIVMDPGYNELNRNKIIENAKLLNIPIEIFETPIFNSVVRIENNPCYICARMRRGYLYEKAKKLGCNKIALGHHFDDVIETILMGMFYGGQLQTMMPKILSTSHPGMELIRPLYYVEEKDILAWKEYNDLRFLQCACRFTEKAEIEDEISPSARLNIKNLIKELKMKIPDIENHIFKSIHNCNVDTMVGWKYKGKNYDFNEVYENREE